MLIQYFGLVKVSTISFSLVYKDIISNLLLLSLQQYILHVSNLEKPNLYQAANKNLEAHFV